MKLLKITALIITFGISSQSIAAQSIASGDTRSRADIQLLADWGVITQPVSTWPLPKSTLQALARINLSKLPLHVAAAAKRLQQAQNNRYVALSVDSGVQLLRGYQNTNRNKTELSASYDFSEKVFAGRLNVTGTNSVLNEEVDDNKVRFDDSYIAAQWGNWTFNLGAESRWWGPSWHGNLIMSNNAKAIPSLTIQRADMKPFETKWLSWLGAWQLTTTFGQLESDREVPDPRFFGMRFNFKPTNRWEFGLSRTAQWAGEGRPSDLGVFIDLLLGNDNQGDGDNDEPGNQLGGFDIKYTKHIGKTVLGVYTQWIGEDEAGFWPSKFMSLLGVELAWGDNTGNTYRLTTELANTKAEIFNVGYNHHRYPAGYRYYGRSIGHTADNDATMFSAELITVFSNGDLVSAKIVQADLNKDGAGRNGVSAIADDLTGIYIHGEKRLNQHWGFSGGIHHESLNAADESDTGVNAAVKYYW